MLVVSVDRPHSNALKVLSGHIIQVDFRQVTISVKPNGEVWPLLTGGLSREVVIWAGFIVVEGLVFYLSMVGIHIIDYSMFLNLFSPLSCPFSEKQMLSFPFSDKTIFNTLL